jgi:hypothetical protein
MEHMIATSRRFGPTGVGVEIGAEHIQALADLAGPPDAARCADRFRV